MNRLLTRVLQKFAALGLLAAVLAAVWFLVVEQISGQFTEYEQNMDRQLELLARFRAVGATRDELQQRVEKLRRLETSRGGFLDGTSANVAAAALQERIKDIVTRNGALLKSSQVYSSETVEQGFEKVSLGLTIVGDIEALLQILHSIETGPPFLFIEEFDGRQQVIRQRVRSRTASGRIATPEDTETLMQARIRVAGYLRRAVAE